MQVTLAAEEHPYTLVEKFVTFPGLEVCGVYLLV